MSVWDRSEDPTSEQLLAEWTGDFNIGTRQIRSHRRPPRFTRTQLIAAVLTFAGALSISSGTAPTSTDHLTTSAPPSDTLVAPASVTEQSVDAGLRGGARVSRTLERTTPPRQGVTGTARERLAPRWVRPLATMRVTSCFGPRWGRMHGGLDLGGRTGTPIHAVGAGRVVQAGWNFRGMGYSVTIDHGAWHTVYAHASRVLVKVGQRVAAGTRIARVGSTGHATGPHLHLVVAQSSTMSGMWDRLVNPAPWLKSRGVAVLGCA